MTNHAQEKSAHAGDEWVNERLNKTKTRAEHRCKMAVLQGSGLMRVAIESCAMVSLVLKWLQNSLLIYREVRQTHLNLSTMLVSVLRFVRRECCTHVTDEEFMDDVLSERYNC